VIELRGAKRLEINLLDPVRSTFNLSGYPTRETIDFLNGQGFLEDVPKKISDKNLIIHNLSGMPHQIYLYEAKFQYPADNLITAELTFYINFGGTL